MQTFSIPVKDFISKSATLPVIDVRSPGEYDHGHIPGAINMPLFSNEERSVIGTLYWHKGSSEAVLKGLELIGPKIREFAEKGISLAPGGELLLHCWRGGMRSNSMAWLMNTAGLKVYTLTGGYKSYRRFTKEVFEKPFNLVVIGGMTGSGKSEIIEELDLRGMQVIHLEKLASHKGSVFGSIGMPEQPTTEHFENELCRCLLSFDAEKPVFIEDESLAIGNIFLPHPFYDQMSSASFICVKVPFAERVNRILNSYHSGDKQLLINAVKRIEKRLGSESARDVTESILSGQLQTAVEILLKYYDKIYQRSMMVHRRKSVTEIAEQRSDPYYLAGKIIETACVQ